MTPLPVQRRAGRAGTFAALALHYWMLTGGTWDLFRFREGAGFFDAQASAWLDGQWAVPPDVVGLEGIVHDGETQMYFGVFPAVLRLPIAVFTDQLDGRLAAASMLLAVVIVLGASRRLWWQARSWLRPDEPWTRRDGLVDAAVPVLVGGGTSLIFLSSRSLVYHEAAMWGVALTLVALTLAVSSFGRLNGDRLAVIGVVATAAVASRVSVGLGAVAVLGLLALGLTISSPSVRRVAGRLGRPFPGSIRRAFRRLSWLGPGSSSGTRTGELAVAAWFWTAVPVAAYAAVNWIRFETLFSIPLRNQVQSAFDPARDAFFAANGGFFGLQFAPTAAANYLGVANVELSSWFPYVDFGATPGPVIGDVTFDLVDRTAGVPATSGFLVVLALVGIGTLFSGRGSGPFRFAALGAAAGAVTIFGFGYITHRYQADMIPLLVVLGVVGLERLMLVRAATARRGAIAAVAVLALVGIWFNTGLALLEQRLWGTDVPAQVIADFVDLRLDIADRDPFDPTPSVSVGPGLPATGNKGDFAVIGNCSGLYVHDGVPPDFLEVTSWTPVERTRQSGLHRFEVTFRSRPPSEMEPILVTGVDIAPGVLAVEHLTQGRGRLVWLGSPADIRGPEIDLEPGVVRGLTVAADRHVNQIQVTLDGRTVLQGFYGALDDGVVVGRLPAETTRPDPTTPDAGDQFDNSDRFSGVSDRFSGTLIESPVTTAPLCPRLLP